MPLALADGPPLVALDIALLMHQVGSHQILSLALSGHITL